MKAERKEEEKWVPIVITLESKEEAQYLYHCLYADYADIKKYKGNEVPFPDLNKNISTMFDEIYSFVNYLQ